MLSLSRPLHRRNTEIRINLWNHINAAINSLKLEGFLQSREESGHLVIILVWVFVAVMRPQDHSNSYK